MKWGGGEAGQGRHVLVLLVAIALGVLLAGLASDAQAEQLDRHQVRALVAEAWPAPVVEYVVRIAWCESRFETGAVAQGFDSRLRVFYRYEGLLQVDPWLHRWRVERRFGPGAGLHDGRVNVHVAAEIFAEQGWNAWPYCSRHA